MRAIYPLIMMLLGSSAIWGQVASRGPLPDAGISDEELDKKGDAAEALLLDRLDVDRNEKYYGGILHRLALRGDLKTPNKKLVNRLIRFIDRRSNCEGEVTSARINSLGTALRIVGQRGGTEAIEYLAKWAATDEPYSRVNCYYSGSKVAKARDYLRTSAVLGLGLNPTKDARDRLIAIRRNPPKVDYPGSYVGVLDQAIDDNQKIQEMGVDKFYADDLKRLKARKDGAGRK